MLVLMVEGKVELFLLLVLLLLTRLGGRRRIMLVVVEGFLAIARSAHDRMCSVRR